MPRRAAQPVPVEQDNYSDRARPQRTPDRKVTTTTGTYTVVSNKTVHGLKPGETGELTLTEGEQLALFQAGHLVPADGEDGRSADNAEVNQNG